jgi:hypothetical protein
MALAEAGGLSRKPDTRAAAQKAAEWTCAQGLPPRPDGKAWDVSSDEAGAEMEKLSGWAYAPREKPHLFPTLLVVM